MFKNYYVYLLLTKRNKKYISYVGCTTNLHKRLKLHNSGKGAKFTKGSYWKIIYKKKFKSKSLAMSNEYMLKKNYTLRKKIKKKYIWNEKKNFYNSSL